MIESVVCFKYLKPTYRTVYTSAHVNALREMVRKHYRHPHRFLCVTDDPHGLDSGIEAVPLWDDHFELINPSHPTARPNCYPRLKTFSREFEAIAGKRFVSLDLDMVITGDLAPLWGRPDEFVIYDARGDDHYNGSMFMMSAGARAQVWEKFDPIESPKKTTAAGMRGSDQAWIRYCLAPNAETWTNADGVHAYLHIIRDHPDHASKRHGRRRTVRTHAIRRGALATMAKADPPRYAGDGALPPGARMVIFAGEYKPWDPRAHKMSPWIRQHYPGL